MSVIRHKFSSVSDEHESHFILYFQAIPNFITNISAMGHRVYATDVQESFHFLRYKRQENQLIVFADDTHPRWITAACKLDYDTVAGADKFGNISVVCSTSFALSSFPSKNTSVIYVCL